MTKHGQVKLGAFSMLLTIVAIVAILFTPTEAASEEGCWFEDEYSDHGTCSTNDCWFWQDGVRCKRGAWYGGCSCDPINNG